MSRKKNFNVQLFLIEAIILMAVFAVSSTFIISIFIKGNDMRLKADRLNEAVIYAQNVAEAMRQHEEIELLSSDALVATVNSTIKNTEVGHINYYQIEIRDRYTNDVIYEIETGIYDDKN